MADISMCQNLKCPKHLFCARFRAVPNEYNWQAYGSFSPGKDGVCESHYPLREYGGRIRSLEEITEAVSQWQFNFSAE